MNNKIYPLFNNTQSKIDCGFPIPDTLFFVISSILTSAVPYSCDFKNIMNARENVVAKETNTSYKTIVKQLNSLSSLRAGWNNEPTAQPISKEIIENIKGILKQSEDKYLLGWNAFPCINGSVLLDLSINDRVDATINFAKDKISAFFRTPFTYEIIDNVDYEDNKVLDFIELVFLHKTSCATFLK